MFDNLSERLQGVFKSLKGQGKLSESNISDALRQVRIALLEADVSLPVAKAFLEQVRERAVGQEVLKGLNPGQAVVGVVRDEMVHLLERQHTDRFRVLMEQCLPDWRLRKDELNETPLAHEEWRY